MARRNRNLPGAGRKQLPAPPAQRVAAADISFRIPRPFRWHWGDWAGLAGLAAVAAGTAAGTAFRGWFETATGPAVVWAAVGMLAALVAGSLVVIGSLAARIWWFVSGRWQ